ncbi:MAG: phosphodiesterase [Chloroflexota bacterium]
MKLILIGDVHISAESGNNRGVDSADNLAQAIAHINSHHVDAACCLFLGDLAAHQGTVGEYQRLRNLLQPLRVPAALMLGNHDNRHHFQTVFPEATQDENGFVQFTLDFGTTHRLIALDTLNAPPYDPMRRHVGHLCSQRLAFLEESLQAAGERDVLIAMHHPPFRIGLPGMDVIRLFNGDEFLTQIGRFPNVKQLLFGHVHRPISGHAHGYSFACLRSLSVQTPLDLVSVDPNAGVAEPPSYTVAILNDDSILLHEEAFTNKATPVSTWETQLAENEQLAKGFQLLVDVMLPESRNS